MQAELDRAKAKVAYHVMKHLADDAHFVMPPAMPKTQKQQPKVQQQIKQINDDKDKSIAEAKALLSSYQQAANAGKTQEIIKLAASLSVP
jgi:hypothetical protein